MSALQNLFEQEDEVTIVLDGKEFKIRHVRSSYNGHPTEEIRGMREKRGSNFYGLAQTLTQLDQHTFEIRGWWEDSSGYMHRERVVFQKAA